MKNKILFSVIMPCYNEEKFVSRAIDSILNQTLRDFEFIIYDDASTDNTKDIIQSYADKDNRIVFIQNGVNMGYAASLNHGISIANSDLIVRMDSDDISYPNRFAIQYNFLSKNPSIDIVGTSVRLINRSDHSVIGVCNLNKEHEDIVANRYTTSFNFHPTIMAKKNLFVCSGGYNTEILRSEEYDLWLRTYKTFRFHNIQEVLLDYYVKGTEDLLRLDHFRSALKVKLNHMKDNEGVIRNIPLILKIIVAFFLKKILKKTYL